MIKFVNVTKEYKDGASQVVLNDVSFDIDDGEFVFMVGPSGAGKSTIIKLLICEEKPDKGEIFYNDISLRSLRRSKLPLLRRDLGVIFQDYKLLPHKTVYENVAFALEVSNHKDSEIKEVTENILEIVGLERKLRNFPDQLSGGERQRVAIARALVNDPAILLADEPTGNLDADNAWEVIQLLNRINNWGTTVIMATHNQEIVNTLKKRVIEIKGGNVVKDDKVPQEEKTEPIEEEVPTKKKQDNKKKKSTKSSKTNEENN